MKVDMSKLVVNQKGEVEITVDDVEDFWTLANVIRVGDKIKSQIRRKVNKVSSTGKTDSRVILTNGVVRITEINYQAGVNEMHLRGTLTHDLGDAKAGTFQRILIEPSRPFILKKSCWDKFTYDELKEASDPTLTANIAAVIMKSGLASICVVGRNTTVVLSKVSKSIPKIRQHGGSGKSAEAKTKFFQLTADALIKVPRLQEMKCIIVASPGFLQHEFVQYLRNNAVQYNMQAAFQADKFIETSVSNGDANELDQVLIRPEVQNRVSDLRAVQQAKAFEDFLTMMGNDQNMIMFGESNIRNAADQNAVKELLVTDNYIRSLELEPRLSFLAFKDRLEKEGVDVIVFSSRHVSGQQLQDLGAIVAILKYPIVNHEDDADESFDD